MPPGAAIEVDTMKPHARRMPIYARYRLLSVSAVIMTIAWLVVSTAYLLEGLTFTDLLALLRHGGRHGHASSASLDRCRLL